MRDGNVAISLVYRAERYIPPHLERNILVSYIYKHPYSEARFCLVWRTLFSFYSGLEGLNHRPLDMVSFPKGLPSEDKAGSKPGS